MPAYADRKGDYLRPMLACAVLTVALAALLTAATSLPMAVVGLVVLGGPAGVGSSLLYAHLRFSGASPADVVNTRAIVSFAWVAGPPLATLIIGTLGDRAILVAIAAVAVLNVVTTAAMLAARKAASGDHPGPRPAAGETQSVSRTGVTLIVGVFIALQAANSAAVSIMTLFVTETLGLNVIWGGIALGVAAGLEIPALLLIARLGHRFSNFTLIASGCLVGVAYYTALVFVSGPVMLIVLQIWTPGSSRWSPVSGLTCSKRSSRGPGLASGLFVNTRRIGAIVSGPIIAFGSMSAFGYGGTFAACAALTLVALIGIGVVAWTTKRRPQDD